MSSTAEQGFVGRSSIAGGHPGNCFFLSFSEVVLEVTCIETCLCFMVAPYRRCLPLDSTTETMRTWSDTSGVTTTCAKRYVFRRVFVLQNARFLQATKIQNHRACTWVLCGRRLVVLVVFCGRYVFCWSVSPKLRLCSYWKNQNFTMLGRVLSCARVLLESFWTAWCRVLFFEALARSWRIVFISAHLCSNWPPVDAAPGAFAQQTAARRLFISRGSVHAAQVVEGSRVGHLPLPAPLLFGVEDVVETGRATSDSGGVAALPCPKYFS